VSVSVNAIPCYEYGDAVIESPRTLVPMGY
jgi:hypothetical protein